MLKYLGLLILPTQGVSGLAGSATEFPLKSSAGLIWIQGDKPAWRQTVELHPLQSSVVTTNEPARQLVLECLSGSKPSGPR